MGHVSALKDFVVIIKVPRPIRWGKKSSSSWYTKEIGSGRGRSRGGVGAEAGVVQ